MNDDGKSLLQLGLLLLHDLHHVHDEGLELFLRDFAVSVGIKLLEDVTDVLLRGLLHVEGVGQSLQQLPQLVPFDGARIVGVELVEGVP